MVPTMTENLTAAAMEATPQTFWAKLMSALDAMQEATTLNGGVLPDPSPYRLEVQCNTCGHLQFPYALDPIFEGEELVECIAGSQADFCDLCDGSAVVVVGWLPAEEAPI